MGFVQVVNVQFYFQPPTFHFAKPPLVVTRKIHSEMIRFLAILLRENEINRMNDSLSVSIVVD